MDQWKLLLVFCLSMIIVKTECKEDHKDNEIKPIRYKRKIVSQNPSHDNQKSEDSHSSESGFRSVVVHEPSAGGLTLNRNNVSEAAYSVTNFQQYHPSTPAQQPDEKLFSNRPAADHSSTEIFFDPTENNLFNERSVNENLEYNRAPSNDFYSADELLKPQVSAKRNSNEEASFQPVRDNNKPEGKKPKYERKSRYKAKSEIKKNQQHKSDKPEEEVASQSTVEINKNLAWKKVAPNVEISSSVSEQQQQQQFVGKKEGTVEDDVLVPDSSQTEEVNNKAIQQKMFKKRKQATYLKNVIPSNGVQQNALYVATNYPQQNGDDFEKYFGGEVDGNFDHNYVLQRSNKFDLEDAMVPPDREIFPYNENYKPAFYFKEDNYRLPPTPTTTALPSYQNNKIQYQVPVDQKQGPNQKKPGNQLENYNGNENLFADPAVAEKDGTNYQYFSQSDGAGYKILPPFTLKPEGPSTPYITGGPQTHSTQENFVYNPYLPHLGYFPKGYVRNIEFDVANGKEKKMIPSIVIPLTKEMMNSQNILNSPYLTVVDNFQHAYNNNPQLQQPYFPKLGAPPPLQTDNHFGAKYPYTQHFTKSKQSSDQADAYYYRKHKVLPFNYHHPTSHRHPYSATSQPSLAFYYNPPHSKDGNYYLQGSSTNQNKQQLQHTIPPNPNRQVKTQLASSNIDVRQNRINVQQNAATSAGSSGSLPFSKSYSNDYSNRRSSSSSDYKSYNSEFTENEMLMMDY